MTAFAGNSYATDLVNPPSVLAPPEPPVFEEPPGFDWNSPYLGLNAGYGIGKATIGCWHCHDLSGNDFPGGRVGAFVGQNWAISSGFVAGIEGDVSYDWNGRSFNGAREVGTGLAASARVRFGQRMGDGLFYVAGGWTTAEPYLKDPDEKARAHGWTLGAGMDWAISEVTFVRAEYRFNRLGEVSLRGIDTQFDQSTVNIGLAVRF